MNKTIQAFGACLLLLVSASTSSLAQERKPIDFVEMGNKRALTRAPFVGDKLDDLKAFDAKGNPLDLNDRKGRHVVVVTGCLT